MKPAGDPEEVFIRELYHSKAMAFEIFFCIYLMFRKVTVLSLQGGTETGLNREADDRAKTHIGKHFCPGVYNYLNRKDRTIKIIFPRCSESETLETVIELTKTNMLYLVYLK